MDKIIDGLFVGSAMAESDLAKLQENGITHILTVASNYAPSYPNHFAYKSISIEDMEQENIIQYFPECNEYIREAISSGGQILVHCLAGQSRSATVSLAYMMQRDGIGRDEALAAMKARRPQVHPNPGFMDQLELYYDLRYEVSPSKPLYRRFLIDHSAEHFREYGSVGHVELGNDPLAQPMPAQRMWRCKKCRRPLVTEANVLDHQPGPGQAAFSWNKRDASGVDTPHAFPQNRACSSLFIEPMTWMAGVEAGLVESKICCPKCDAKLGAFSWAGAQCSCGKWVTPSFQIHRNRVDEVRQNPLLPRRIQ